MKKMKKGFTLIELLIVIAIIGILAGVILVSTSSARQKAQVAAMKQTMKSVMPYLAECIVGEGAVANNGTAGQPICTPASTDTPNWPVLGNCTGAIAANDTTYSAAGCGGTAVITCNVAQGDCSST